MKCKHVQGEVFTVPYVFHRVPPDSLYVLLLQSFEVGRGHVLCVLGGVVESRRGLLLKGNFLVVVDSSFPFTPVP